MADEPSASRRRACPICAKPSEEAYRPFCSKRCADVDLNRWLKGGYAIPAAPDEEDGETSAAQGGDLDRDRAW